MALQLFKIASTTVETPQTTIDFTSIPSGYTDLKLVVSARTTNYYLTIKWNNSTTGYSKKLIQGTGAAATSSTGDSTTSYTQLLLSQNNGATGNTFNNAEIYIPNYNSSNYKSYAIDTVQENNGTTAYVELVAGLWSNTSAINQITLSAEGGSNPTILAGSTATLYGVL